MTVMTDARTASQQITDEVTSWPGVSAGPGRRGEFAFRVGHREIGHLHGDHAAHFFFPKDVWAELFEQGQVTTTRCSRTRPARPRGASRTTPTCAT